MIAKKMTISGKRKTAVAKLILKEGNGHIYFNHLSINVLPLFHKLALMEPVRIYEQELGEKLKHNLVITAIGGGKESQIQAARLAIAKTLLKLSGSDTLKKAYVAYDRSIIVADSRRKEASKPGDSAPRAKRQKSYR